VILARYGRRLINLLDDTPVVPGDVRQPFANAGEARQVLTDAEQELQQWRPNLEAIHTNAGGMGTNLMPADDLTSATSEAGVTEREDMSSPQHHKNAAETQGTHLEQATAS
jgi:Eisosome component PIL1